MDRPKVGVVIHVPLRDQILLPADRARLAEAADVRWTDAAAPLSVEQAVELLADCEVGIGSWGTPYPTPELLAGCSKLRLWEHAAGTMKHMFGPHVVERGLIMGSCKTAIADCVAEMTLGEIILGLRRVIENTAANREGPVRAAAGMKVLYGSTVGIIGASEVGRRVIRLLAPFRCRILLYDPFVSDEAARELGAEKHDSVAAVCATSDVVSLHTPDIPACAGIVGANELQAMRDDTIFINTSRGRCVDQAALTAELEKGRLTAYLDVTEPEPAPADSPLRRLPNVYLTSHIAGPPSYNIGRQAVDDVLAFLSGGMPMCPQSADQLDRIA